MEVQYTPSTELAVIVALVATEGALLEVPEVQSPTPMIQRVLGELAPREETIGALEAIEEEEKGSSSTPGKDDAEDIPAGQPEALPVATQLEQVEAPPREQSLIVVEESVPEGGEEGFRA